MRNERMVFKINSEVTNLLEKANVNEIYFEKLI